MTIKVRGSEAGFMWGRLVYTEYDTACLRKILLRSRGVRATVAEVHNERGKTYEGLYEQRFPTCQREVPVVLPVDGVDGADFSSRVDLIVGSGDDVVVHELKSTESKNVLRNVIKSGAYKVENLAQLISYMIAVGTDRGQLSYGYLERDANNAYQIKQERTFKIVVDAVGRIVVDSVPTKWTIYDQIAHTQTSAKVQKEGIIWDRPAKWDAPFGSPCGYCPFKLACEKYDSGSIESVDAFVEISQQCLKQGDSK